MPISLITLHETHSGARVHLNPDHVVAVLSPEARVRFVGEADAAAGAVPSAEGHNYVLLSNGAKIEVRESGDEVASRLLR